MESRDYISLFEQSPALLVVLDPHFNIVTISDAYLKATLIERENVINRNIFDVFPEHPNDKSSAVHAALQISLNRVLDQQVADKMEIQKHAIRKPQSEGGEFVERYWSVLNSPLLDDDKNVKYIIQHIEDVTKNEELIANNLKLKNHIELLAESYEYAEEIIATIDEPFLILNSEFKIKSASKSFYKKYKITKDEAEGVALFDLNNKQWDIPGLRSHIENILICKTASEDLEATHPFYGNGDQTIVFTAKNIFQKTHSEQLILLAIKDISEVRRLSNKLQLKEKKTLDKQLETEKIALKKIEDSEKRYNMMLTNSPYSIAILKGKNMVVSLANASIKEIWGKGNDVEGKEFTTILPEIKDTQFPALLNEVYTTGIPFYGNELLAPLVRNGKTEDAYFNFVYQPYQEADKTISGVTIIAYEVTAQVIAKNELIESKINAEQKTLIAEEAVRSKQQFLSNMSHEIRTPMNAIIGFTNIILKTELNNSQQEYITAIKESGDALIILINDILDIAKVDAGMITFETTIFKLTKSISTTLHLFEQKILEKNIALIHNYDPAIPKYLIGDPMRLRQIILNLMSNAIKFTSKGEISVNVRQLSQDSESVTIEFIITDTGIGIAKDRLEHIFKNFEQATKTTSTSYGGTGLGLAIVKQLVERQGGTIIASSEHGVGSSFGFRMNFKKSNRQELVANDELGTSSFDTYKEAITKGTKVLVVEDVVLNQLLIKIILLDFGFEIEMADNGRVAVELLEKNEYDIILMDLQMPEMNGFEATAHIRNILNSQIPIIALTADVTNADVEKCIAVGMNDYISKPIDEKLLFDKISKHLVRV
ncbi:response regulator [Flavobacterium sp. XN-5]|uniref:PAS domain-containing hybrid sensor histidine kinase/response regulator n=1 Tax=Flavobacterium sp. XN-5 TaxID=2599390 RepID=UPI0011CCB1B2|nr:ATP-binding protein [Flavobacterium sp. XN-5]NGY37482.1 response regulator [Flavobacterium sp. XN-5]